MLRKQIYIEPQQDYMLKAKALELHVSESELIREGISRVLETGPVLTKNLKAWEDEKKFMISLAKKEPVKGGRGWEREDLYDRKVSGRH